MKTYLAFSKDRGAIFAFNAKNEIDAHKKVISWNEYHSLKNIDSKAMTVEISESDLSHYKVAVHNEYIF